MASSSSSSANPSASASARATRSRPCPYAFALTTAIVLAAPARRLARAKLFLSAAGSNEARIGRAMEFVLVAAGNGRDCRLFYALGRRERSISSGQQAAECTAFYGIKRRPAATVHVPTELKTAHSASRPHEPRVLHHSGC